MLSQECCHSTFANLCPLFSTLRKGRLHYIHPVHWRVSWLASPLIFLFQLFSSISFTVYLLLQNKTTTKITTTTITMIIPMDRPLTNDHPDGPASCKRSSGGTSLLQMIIRMERPLANDHLDGPASCK